MKHLYVKAPEGGDNSPQRMQRADETVLTMGGMFKNPRGTPLQEPDGTYEVRIFEDAWVGYVKQALEGHHGLQVVREA